MSRNGTLKLSRTSKRILILVSAVVLSVMIVIVGTFAWIKTSDAKSNNLRGANLEAIISENFTPNGGLVADVPYTKEVSVTNNQNQSIFVRVMAMPEISYSDASGTIILDPTVLTIDINTTDWTDGDDGYYYYRHSLAPGQTTQKLFTTVTIPSTVDPTYDGAMVNISIRSEATTISKNNSYRTSWWGGTTPTSAPLSTIDGELQTIVAAEGV